MPQASPGRIARAQKVPELDVAGSTPVARPRARAPTTDARSDGPDVEARGNASSPRSCGEARVQNEPRPPQSTYGFNLQRAAFKTTANVVQAT
jgi:hypothetical protein